MSIWTYANIKFTVRKSMTVSDIEEYFGFMDTWEHLYMFERRNDDISKSKSNEFLLLPCGSEGTLDILIKKTAKNKTVFHILGGLRDYSNTENIVDWFNKIIAKDKNNDYNIIIKAKGYARSDMDKKSTKFNYSEEAKNKIKHLIKNIEFFIQWIICDTEFILNNIYKMKGK